MLLSSEYTHERALGFEVHENYTIKLSRFWSYSREGAYVASQIFNFEGRLEGKRVHKTLNSEFCCQSV